MTTVGKDRARCEWRSRSESGGGRRQGPLILYWLCALGGGHDLKCELARIAMIASGGAFCTFSTLLIAGNLC